MRRGSLQFWPRKRATRIYPRANWTAVVRAAEGDPKLLGFAAWKAGTTHVSYINPNAESPSSGKMITNAVTILDVPALLAVGVRYYGSSDGALKSVGEEWATVPKDAELERKTTAGKKKPDIDISKITDIRLIVATQPKKSGMHKKKPDLLEIGISGPVDLKLKYAQSLLGKEIRAEDIFSSGEYVDVSAVTKGHGYTGPVKRFGIRIQTRKDKQMHRHPGSIGSTVPRKVDWRVPLAGQHGFFARTEYNKRILLIDKDGKRVNQKGGIFGYGLVNDFMLLEGSVPGSQKRLVVLRKAMRKKTKVPVTVDYISTSSKQGAR